MLLILLFVALTVLLISTWPPFPVSRWVPSARPCCRQCSSAPCYGSCSSSPCACASSSSSATTAGYSSSTARCPTPPKSGWSVLFHTFFTTFYCLSPSLIIVCIQPVCNPVMSIQMFYAVRKCCTFTVNDLPVQKGVFFAERLLFEITLIKKKKKNIFMIYNVMQNHLKTKENNHN